MDDETIDKFIATISEQMLNLEHNQAQMRAALTVLKGIVVLQISPDDPIEGAKQLRHLEQMLVNADPLTQERTRVAEIIEAVKLWQKHGGGKHEA